MKSINVFLGSKTAEIKRIIAELPEKFNSHQFIQRLAKRFELQYIEFLYSNKGKGAFQRVHSEIARHLSANKTELSIEPVSKVDSTNVFGEISSGIQLWKKV